MAPLRHCGAGADAAWRRGYRNKLELAVGVASDGALAVGVQLQHQSATRKAGRGRGREQYPLRPTRLYIYQE